MKKKASIADILIFLVVFLIGLTCLLPLINVVAISFSDNAAATANRIGIIPVNFTTSAYKKILEDVQFWRSFLISVIRVIVGTSINMLLLILTAYPLSKSKREFKAQSFYMKIALFAMLFPAGMIPLYMVVKNLKMINTILALILPTAINIGNVILMMNFFRATPKALEEAAEIDGANPWQILLNVVLPMSIPCIATISLFCIVGHWNDYFSAILYINKPQNYPLQTYIQQISATIDMSKLNNIELLKQYLEVSSKTLNSAKIVVSTIPLLLIYLFLQRYFVTGIVMGAVKE